MQDRVSLYPGRVKLEPVAGQANTYDLTRADQPTQEGTPLNKASLLKDTTAALLGLPNTAVPDDAFVALVLGQGVYGYRVKVQLADGTPVEGATVSGIQPLTGSTLVTGADGTVLGKSTSASVTIGCTSPYIDQKAPAAQTVTKTGTITDVTLTLESITDMLTISSSKTAKISSMAKRIDIFASGGGGGGGYHTLKYPGAGGAGGGGGYASNKLNVSISGDTDLKIVVGAGGAGGKSEENRNGQNGGETTVYLNNVAALTASGGFGAQGSDVAGEGNGKGGVYFTEEVTSRANGFPASVTVFNDSSIGVKTGGGGGAGGSANNPDNKYGFGGFPCGGDGGNANIGAKNGGVGGGGGGGDYPTSGVGASGGDGIVYLRFHFDAA